MKQKSTQTRRTSGKIILVLALMLSLAAIGFAAESLRGQIATDGVSLTVRGTLIAPAAPATQSPLGPPEIKGLAILGDSTQDEYQADTPRGGEFGATTRNWVEILAEARHVNLGPWGTRPEPRRSGYLYNWARSAATSKMLLDSGQHTGAAAQIRRGWVSHVLIQVGINDMADRALLAGIYTGDMPEETVHARLNYVAQNIGEAVRTVRDAGKARVLLAPVQDYMPLVLGSQVDSTFPDPAGRDRVHAAFVYLNEQIALVAQREGVDYFDFNAALQAEVRDRLDSDGFLVVGGVRIDLNTRGNDPHYAMLDDEYAHPGTVLSALMTNIYIRAMNDSFGTAISPLTDAEILSLAGIANEQRNE